MAKLNDGDILEMYVRQGMTTGEISNRLGIPEVIVVDVLRKYHYIKD